MPLPAQIRHAIRTLGRTPLFAAIAVGSLAVGIGANSAIFTAANAIFLAPAAGVTEPDQLVDIGRTTEGRGFDTVSFGTYADLRGRDSVFDGVYAYRFEAQPVSLGAETGAERVYGEQVSAGYFDVLGLRPEVGIFFRTDEERLGVPLRKVVLSYDFWQAHFKGQAGVVGQDLVLNGDHFTIAAVAPRGYRGMTVNRPDLWLPLTSYARGLPGEETLQTRENVWLVMGGRLKPGVSLLQAQGFLAGFAADLAREFPEVYRGRGLVASPASRLPGIGREYVAPFLAILLGVTGLVLLVTCANLAGLLLARSAARSREVAVRLALGASRRSLLGLLMTESAILAAGGAVAAVVVAWWTSRTLAGVIPQLPIPLALDLTIDWRVLLFTLGVAVAAMLLAGLIPAMQGSRADLVNDLKQDAGAPRRQRLRQVFITAQLAFCVVLVVMAGLFLRALGTAAHLNPGFEVDNIEVVSLDLALGGYATEQSADVSERLREALAAVPGVERAGFARMIPLDGGGLGLGGLRPAGTLGREAEIDTDWNVVSPDYFAALGIPVLRGRLFGASDREGAARVAIVNERMANMVWPGQDPVGQRLENGDFRPGREASIETLTVVGVVRDAKYRWIGEAPAPFIYVPYAQQPMRDVHYFLKRAPSLSADMGLLSIVRDVIRRENPNLPLVRMQPLQSYADLGLLPQRLAASVAGSLGVVALLLAGMGIYGVTALAVTSRTKEFGVRMALGADRARVMGLVLRQGARLTAIGGAVGLVLALALTQVVSSLLFGVSPVDPITYGGTLGVLAVITLAATALPARRAASIDPLTSLKAE